MEKKCILIADDEERIVKLVSDFFVSAGFDTVCAANGIEALKILESGKKIDLAIIDIMMPEMDGWQLTREMRRFTHIPVIMLSARSEEFDLLTGFEAGADEYVTKPFSPAVLVKRAEALLKRSSNMVQDTEETKGLSVDRKSFNATLNGQQLELTLKEFELLAHLYDHSGLVLTREQLLDAVWGFDYIGDSRTVDSHIARLRTKLGDYGASHLKTIYGMGYKLEI